MESRVRGTDNYMRWFCVFSVALCLLLMVIEGCHREKPEIISTDENQVEYPSQEGWDSEMFLTKAGLLQAVVRYGHMRKYDKRKVVLFDEGVEVDFYDDNGKHRSHLTSEQGEYHEGTENVIGMGNVVVVSDSGVTLHTEVLRWDNHRGKILSDTTIMLTTLDQDTLYGVGFESEPDLSRRVIRKPLWVSQRRVDIEELDSSFSKPSPRDSIADKDSTSEIRQ
ncbi:MAG: LPS export ABC transporter periplasmic protein LptC [bacterium]